jgi:hypothetical protein
VTRNGGSEENHLMLLFVLELFAAIGFLVRRRSTRRRDLQNADDGPVDNEFRYGNLGRGKQAGHE